MFRKTRFLAVVLAVSLSVAGLVPVAKGASGCGGGGCGSSSSGKYSIGNIRLAFDYDQAKILNTYGSIHNGTTLEMNISGFWFKPTYRPGWMVSGVDYHSGTKVSFDVTDSIGDNKYYYSQTGSWTSNEHCREETAGRIPLQYVMDSNDNGTKFEYNYDSTNNRVTAIDKTGASDRYVIYGGVDPSESSDSVDRVWMGTYPSDYRDRADPNSPLSGRWVDMDIDASTNMVTSFISGCGTCETAATKNFTYVPANTNRIRHEGYDPDDPNTWDPQSYLISQIKDGSDNVLVSYSYDDKDRVTSHKLGAAATITEMSFTDCEYVMYNHPGDPGYDPEGFSGAIAQGSNSVTRRDYVDATNYQATVYLSNDNGTLEEMRRYTDLQSGSTLSGTYARTTYGAVANGSGNVVTRTITLPRGNQMHALYGGGNVTKRLRYNVDRDKTIVDDVYSYTAISGVTRVAWSTNSLGGTTNYDYSANGLNVTERIDPEPDAGDYGSGRLTSYYAYDDEGRVTRMISKGSATVTTKYDYDTSGNMITQIAGFSSTDPLTTAYDYNEYNQVTKTVDPRGTIRKNFYTMNGALEADVAYSDTNCSTVLTAVKYAYNNDGRLETESVAKLDGPFPITSSYNDVTTWTETDHLYDLYGRRTAVVADAGTGGRSLTTSYEYNNQSEVTKVTKPDGSISITEREGRGLVSKQISKIGTRSSTTSFYYDLNGNLTKKQDPDGVCEIYDYDGFDRQIRVRRGS